MISKHTLIIAFLLLILSMTACSSSAPAASDPECLTHEDMELTVASAKRSEEDKVVLTYALTNHSKEEYHFGRHFKMEYKKDGTWVEISEYFAQTDDMLMIPAGETIALDAAFLSEPQNGSAFRMTKNVYAKSNRESFDIQCRFEVSP